MPVYRLSIHYDGVFILDRLFTATKNPVQRRTCVYISVEKSSLLHNRDETAHRAVRRPHSIERQDPVPGQDRAIDIL